MTVSSQQRLTEPHAVDMRSEQCENLTLFGAELVDCLAEADLTQWFSKCDSPRNCLEMQTRRPTPKATGSEIPGVGPAGGFNKPSG